MRDYDPERQPIIGSLTSRDRDLLQRLLQGERLTPEEEATRGATHRRLVAHFLQLDNGQRLHEDLSLAAIMRGHYDRVIDLADRQLKLEEAKAEAARLSAELEAKRLELGDVQHSRIWSKEGAVAGLVAFLGGLVTAAFGYLSASVGGAP